MTVLVAIFPEKNNCPFISSGNGAISAPQNLDYSPFNLDFLLPLLVRLCLYSRASFQHMDFYLLPDK